MYGNVVYAQRFPVRVQENTVYAQAFRVHVRGKVMYVQAFSGDVCAIPDILARRRLIPYCMTYISYSRTSFAVHF